MNVRGFLNNGKLSELQITTNNESFLAISRKFQHAVLISPSIETENELKSVIAEISQRRETEYEKMLKFQCNREITKSLIQRGEYEEAKQYLIQNLQSDPTLTNLCADLAICAE